MNFHRLKKALILSAFFIACCFSQASISADCGAFKATETATIRYIHDGDTLFLKDNRKVRLIGIDTPELARKKNKQLTAEQPFARQARDYARQLIRQHGNKVSLMSGIEKADHYQRSLFHIQLADGSLLQQRLLQAGLALAYTYPPNQQLTHCYQKSETQARQQSRNIWSHEKYQIKTIDMIKPNDQGFHIIKGRIRHIGESRKSYWLNFYGKFSARIKKSDLKYFKQPLQNYLEKDVTIRGWLRHYKNKAQMTLRHPSAVELIQP